MCLESKLNSEVFPTLSGYLKEINFREINFDEDLFSRMQILPYFAWIYFRGCQIYNVFLFYERITRFKNL